MKMKNKFVSSSILYMFIPIGIVFLIGIALLLCYLIVNSHHTYAFFSATYLNELWKDPFFQKGFLVWIVILFITIMLSSILNVIFQATTLLKPIQELKISAEKIKRGNLDFEVMGSPYEEVNDLCISFEEMRKRLREMVLIQENYEKERNLMLANLSHDLRTPITSIKGYVEGILDGIADTPERELEYLETIYQKAEDLEVLVGSMSEFSAYELKRIKYDFQPLDVVSLFLDFIRTCELDLESEGIEIKSKIPDKKLVALVDSEKIKRVLTNVVGNAIKYRRNESSTFQFSLEEWDKGICLVIADNGKGISKKDIAKVFESHFRADPARNSQIQGSGLGLSIAKQIVDAHRGKIWLRSEENVGTTVFIYLPLKPE